jgi:hypothetical protein
LVAASRRHRVRLGLTKQHGTEPQCKPSASKLCPTQRRPHRRLSGLWLRRSESTATPLNECPASLARKTASCLGKCLRKTRELLCRLVGVSNRRGAYAMPSNRCSGVDCGLSKLT